MSGTSKQTLQVGSPSVEKPKEFKNSYYEITRLIQSYQPTAIINCTGLVGDRLCNENPSLARLANVDLVRFLSIQALENSAQLVHFSTDAVFGQSNSERTERNTPSPQTIYGKTKLEGEGYVLTASENNVVIRTNFFGHSYSLNRGLFDYFATNFMENKKCLGYNNVYFNPVHISEVTDLTIEILKMGEGGLFHTAGSQILNKLEFGRLVALSGGFSPSLVQEGRLQNKIGITRTNMTLFSFKRIESYREKARIRDDIDRCWSEMKREGDDFENR